MVRAAIALVLLGMLFIPLDTATTRIVAVVPLLVLGFSGATFGVARALRHRRPHARRLPPSAPVTVRHPHAARGCMMRSIRDLELLEPEGFDLPAIDLTATDSTEWSAAMDHRAFDEQYARLGFGLGTVPRRQRRDDPWWETPAGMITVVVGVLLLLWLSTGG